MREHICPVCGARSYYRLYIDGFVVIPSNIVGCDLCLDEYESDGFDSVEEWEVDWDW